MSRAALRLAAVMIAVLVLGALTAPRPATAQGGEILVTVFDDPPPDGSCAAGGDCSLREAVLLTNASGNRGEVIRLVAGADGGAGTYVLTRGAPGNQDAASGDLDVLPALTVFGPTTGLAIIDVVVADRAFDSYGEYLGLHDVTITGGGTVDQGGAIRAGGGGLLELTRVTLRGNQATEGGAVHASVQQTVVITDSVIEANNVIEAGGGVYIDGDPAPASAALTITGGMVRDNTAGGAHGGGGIYTEGTHVTIEGTEVRGNRAGRANGLEFDGPGQTVTLRDVTIIENEGIASGGAGLRTDDLTLLAERLTVDGNEGGGMIISRTNATITDSHVVANVGTGISAQTGTTLRLERSLVEANTGGVAGIFAFGTAMELVSSTVSGNIGRLTGGISAERPVTLTSSTVAGNRSDEDVAANLQARAAITMNGSVLALPGAGVQADDVNCVVGAGGSLSGTGNLVDDASCALGPGSLLDVDAALGPLRANGGVLATHALGAASAAIEAGGAGCPATDGRGQARPVDGDQDGAAACDAGAFEFVPAADLAVTLADGPDPVPTGEALGYTVTVFNAGPQDAVAARLEIALPADLAEVVATTDLGTCTVAGAAVGCELGTLAAAAVATVRVSGRPQAPGTAQATATASSRAVDPTPEDASATTTTTVGEGGGGGSGEVIPTAIAISQARFADPALRPPSGVVLSRDDLFADSLGGAVLTAEAPLLFTATAAMDPRTAAEIDRLLGGTGTVTLLGGDPALSAAVADALTAAGYTVRRLAGPSRVETAIEVARAAAPQGPQTVALARADAPADNPTAAWADAVTAGAWSADSGAPVLLTQTASLHPAVAAYLSDTAPARRVLLGGEPALSSAVADATGPHERVQGSNRYATAAAIATQLWPQPTAGYLLTSGDHRDGWAYALAAAGLAADGSRPVLLVETLRLPPETSTLTCAVDPATRTVIGGDDVVSSGVRDALAMPC